MAHNKQRAGAFLVPVCLIAAGVTSWELLLAPPALAHTSAKVRCPTRAKASTVITSAADCWVDEKISGKRGVLKYTCGKDGPASISFGGKVFSGRARKGWMDIHLRTTFNWQDGCKWETIQRIQGKLSGGTLSYSYTERPLKGQRGCFNPCSASASIKVW